jgi:hypothetical protein
VTTSLVSNQTHVDEAFDFAARGLINPHIEVFPFKMMPEKLKDLVRVALHILPCAGLTKSAFCRLNPRLRDARSLILTHKDG